MKIQNRHPVFPILGLVLLLGILNLSCCNFAQDVCNAAVKRHILRVKPKACKRGLCPLNWICYTARSAV